MKKPPLSPSALKIQYQQDDIGRDALTELVNIAVGRSADALSRLVDMEVLLSIPNIDLMSAETAREELRIRTGNDISLVRQKFEGKMTGDSLLLFPKQNSLELVQLIVQEELPLETLADLEQDVMRELGNILLNSFMGSIGNALELSLQTGLPSYEHILDSSKRSIFVDGDEKDAILVMQVDFNLNSRDVRGYLGLLVGVESVTSLMESVRKYFRI